MKFDPSETPSGALADDDAAAVRQVVRVTRGRTPSPEALERITGRLVAAGALDASARPPRGSSSESPQIANKLSYYKVGALALALAAGALLTWRATSSSTSTMPPSVEARAAGDGRASATSERANVDERKATSAHAPADAPVVPIDALPSAAPTGRAPSASSVDGTGRGAPQAAGSSAAAPELQLVRRAQDALASDPARALALAGEHSALFPNGQLTQEREVVAVEALSRLGRREDALVRARALLRRFPRTPYVAHLEKALGQRLSDPAPHDAAGNPEFNSKP